LKTQAEVQVSHSPVPRWLWTSSLSRPSRLGKPARVSRLDDPPRRTIPSAHAHQRQVQRPGCTRIGPSHVGCETSKQRHRFSTRNPKTIIPKFFRGRQVVHQRGEAMSQNPSLAILHFVYRMKTSDRRGPQCRRPDRVAGGQPRPTLRGAGRVYRGNRDSDVGSEPLRRPGCGPSPGTVTDNGPRPRSH
jgi:hypothetical protein